MAYDRKRTIGGTITVRANELKGNPVVDSYTFEKEFEGVTYQWTGVRPSYLDKDGNLTFKLPDQERHAEGGPYTLDCSGTPLAWDNP